MKKLKKIDFKWVAVALILVAGMWIFDKYAFVAKVNGRYISRIKYLKNAEKQVGKQILDRMITESLIEQEAAKKGVNIDKKEIDDEIAKIEEKIKAQGQTLEAALATEGMTKEDLENQLRIQKMVDKLSDPKKEITEKEIAEFLDKNKDQLPKGMTKDELNKAAKEQLEQQTKTEAANTWFAKIKEEAKIIYK